MKILFLCTYPLQSPLHGGQLRARAIVDLYRRCGHEVQVVGVLGSGQYPPEAGFVPYPEGATLERVLENPFLMEDYAISRLYSEYDDCYVDLVSNITIKPELIHVEQPWLFPFAQRFASGMNCRAHVVYGAQNIEFKLKKAILSSYFDGDRAARSSELVRALEVQTIDQASGIVCVSDTDRLWIKELTERPVELAPNGVKSWVSTAVGAEEARAIHCERRFALYCGSAHPPNMEGFFAMFGGGFGSLAPDQALVIAGGAGYAIAGDIRVHRSAKLAERTVIAGHVSANCLNGLLDAAHCIVLPLTQGGGTNLKTAEALWAGRHIVATTTAMRGFEAFMKAPGVTVADDPIEFKRALRAAMNSSPLELCESERAARRVVLWEECLGALPSFIQGLAQR